MSDSKPKRAAREPARSEAKVEDVIAAAAASVIEQNTKPEPERVSAIALAQTAAHRTGMSRTGSGGKLGAGQGSGIRG